MRAAPELTLDALALTKLLQQQAYCLFERMLRVAPELTLDALALTKLLPRRACRRVRCMHVRG